MSRIRRRRRPLYVRLRRDRLTLMRQMLIDKLGGRCAWCGVHYQPEVDHVDGRVGYQPRQLSATARLQRYAAEYRAGVRLQVLCKWCNSKDGRARQLADDRAMVARAEVATQRVHDAERVFLDSTALGSL